MQQGLEYLPFQAHVVKLGSQSPHGNKGTSERHGRTVCALQEEPQSPEAEEEAQANHSTLGSLAFKDASCIYVPFRIGACYTELCV